MSLNSTTARNDYTGNNSTAVYSYTFKVLASSDLKVTKRDTNNNETLLALNTDYSVSGVGQASGGSVTLTAGNLPTGYKLTIRRVRPLIQATDIRNQGEFYREIHEDVFDHLVMIDQQQQDNIDRAIKLPETVTGVSVELPVPQADKILAWDAAGTAITQKTAAELGGSVTTIGGGLELVSGDLRLSVFKDASKYSSIKAAVDAIGASVVTLIVASAINASSAAEAVTIPAHISIYPVAPGIINKDTATSLTISGPVAGNPMHQWLSGFAAGEVLFGVRQVKEFHPIWFGINTTPGDTDYITPLRVAYSAAASAHGIVILPPETMKITDTWLWNDEVSVIGTDKQYSIIKKYGNFIGIKIGSTVNAQGQEQRYENFSVDNFSGQGDTEVGIEVWSGSGLTMRNVQVLNQGSHGIHLRSGFMGTYDHIKTNTNGGDGFRITGGTGYGSSSANANMITNLDTIGNTGSGFRIIDGAGNSTANFCYGIVSQQNGAYGVYVSDLGNILSVYSEANTGIDIYLDSASIRNFVTINAMGTFATEFSDLGTNNTIMDLAQGQYLRIPKIGGAVQSNNAAGKSFQVQGGNAGAGATGYAGGDLNLLGGDGAGTTGAARGGHVYVSGGEPNGAGSEKGTVYIQLATGVLSFFGASGSTKPTITGSRGANAALADLLTKLATLGLIVDSTS